MNFSKKNHIIDILVSFEDSGSTEQLLAASRLFWEDF